MNEAAIAAFWQEHPCGDQQVSDTYSDDHARFFARYDSFRYSNEPHILHALRRFDWRGRRVLEIGLGEGADSEQLIRLGARWSGIDLTAESIRRVKTRMELRGLTYESLEQGSALSLPHADGAFDVVFSHGVLHHIPDVQQAQREIQRVLKDDGRLVAMLYARHSLNYHIAIRVVRRIGLLALWPLRRYARGIYREHLKNAEQLGLLRYLKMENFIHRSTDGPQNPFSRVYSLEDVRRDFPDFEIVRSFKMWMNAPPLPTRTWPGGGLLGWHLWVELEPRRRA